MDVTGKKMTRVVDELIALFFSIGSDGIKIDLRRTEDGYELTLKSNFDPAERKRVNDLDRFLNAPVRNVGLEEFFWQLAGASGLGQDSELQLIGQMVECRRLEIGENTAEMVLYKEK